MPTHLLLLEDKLDEFLQFRFVLNEESSGTTITHCGTSEEVHNFFYKEGPFVRDEASLKPSLIITNEIYANFERMLPLSVPIIVFCHTPHPEGFSDYYLKGASCVLDLDKPSSQKKELYSLFVTFWLKLAQLPK